MRIRRTKDCTWCTDATEEGAGARTALNSYVINDKIGEGAFGCVYWCVSKRFGRRPREVALKVMNRNRLRKTREPSGATDGRVLYMNGLARLEREVLIMQMLQEKSQEEEALDDKLATEATVVPGSPTDDLSPTSSSLLRKHVTRGDQSPFSSSYTSVDSTRSDACSVRSFGSSLMSGASNRTASTFGGKSGGGVKGNTGTTDRAADQSTMSVHKRPLFEQFIVPLEEVIDDEEDESIVLVYTHMPGGPIMSSGLYSLPDGKKVTRFFGASDVVVERGGLLLVFRGEEGVVEDLARPGVATRPLTLASNADDKLGPDEEKTPHESLSPSRLIACAGYDSITVYAFITQLMKAIEFIHSRGIAHRDIKMDNILLDKNSRVHLADFGCAEYFNMGSGDNSVSTELTGTITGGKKSGSIFEFAIHTTGDVSHTAGTPIFWAPECVVDAVHGVTRSESKDHLSQMDSHGDVDMAEELSKGADMIYLDDVAETERGGDKRESKSRLFDAFKADMWAIGLVVHALLFNRLPFPCEPNQDPFVLFENIAHAAAVPAPYRLAKDFESDSKTVESPGGLSPLMSRHPRFRSRASGRALIPSHASWAEPLLQGLLERDPNKRLTAEEACRMLELIPPPKVD